ncbi:hypothetical protein V498_00047 [Pseudogymnoascus sp. VKM F-4517 (FW-2822)]|nr:hypothetical protein V498_00047 [Pseudogymnoascus sp. VKM F-4517 (FW-2822)]
MSFRSSAPDLNDRGFLADFMVGGKPQKRRPPSATIHKCAFGEGCRKLVISKNVGNVPLPKPSDFCDIHYQCTVTGCSEQRVGSPDKGWWDCCELHQCDLDGCYSPRKYNVLKRKHFMYCPEHKCVRDGCERSHPKWQSYCTTHTCAKTGCGDIVDGDEKLCASPARATAYGKTENTSHSAHATQHARALNAQERKGPARNSAAYISVNSTCAATRGPYTWKGTKSRSPATVPSMNAGN